jgi:simple sugar transport system substrate-binding protein
VHVPGPHNDGGWSQAHERGRLLVQKTFGDKVETTYKENIFSNAQAPQIVAGLVREGYTMIFGCTFGHVRERRQRAALLEVPGRQVRAGDRGCRSSRTSPSTSAPARTRSTSPEWPRRCEQEGPHRLHRPLRHPEVVRHINAFTLGAQATHPGRG